MQYRKARHDIPVAPGPVVVRYCQRHRHVPAVMDSGMIRIYGDQGDAHTQSGCNTKDDAGLMAEWKTRI